VAFVASNPGIASGARHFGSRFREAKALEQTCKITSCSFSSYVQSEFQISEQWTLVMMRKGGRREGGGSRDFVAIRYANMYHRLTLVLFKTYI
jgi:hypothetical protein